MANRPAWVVQELADILGFDEATVAEAILPELESQNHQARLQSHLQDFLGPSPKSRLFIDRYISLRFPSIPTPTPTSQPSLKPPRQPKPTGSWSPQPASGSSTPDLSKEIGEAFGKLGSVYTKITPYTGGSSTPQFRQSTRQAGAVVINDAREGKGKGKAKASNTANEQAKGDKIWDVPKSKEVLRLEGIKEKLGTVQDGGKVSRSDDLPDCFCQARIHKLSTYTPHCPHCGLILCELQPPFLPCPSCSQSLYSSAQLSRLIHRLTNDIESRLALELSHREAEERERQNRLIAESGGGAFPTLPGASHPKQGTVVQNGRKVLTIGKGGKKATLTTTTYRPSPPSTPIRSITPPPNDIVPRPRSPPLDPARIEKEWNKVSGWRHTEDRPWGDMKGDKRGEGWSYVELPLSLLVEEDAVGRRKAAKKKKKDGLGEGGRVVPGAVAQTVE